jgi:hypothetical protein
VERWLGLRASRSGERLGEGERHEEERAKTGHDPLGLQHPPESQIQLAHDPVSGPAELPEEQEKSSPHQPQPDRDEQSVQVKLEAHGSAGQLEATKSQAAQDPFVGPEEVPVSQVLVVSHQPQSRRPVQSAHAPLDAHGSGTGQLLARNVQSAQVSIEGPDEPPVSHRSVVLHQPQLARCVQSPHIVLELHGSEGQLTDVYAQSAQLPIEGPVAPPVKHAFVVVHQPHVARAVQSPQLELTPHGSAPAQLERTKSHIAHDPIAGPDEPPVLQELSDAHQPHCVLSVQSSQDTEVPQGSVPQLSDVHDQLEQLPDAGPTAVPEWHC